MKFLVDRCAGHRLALWSRALGHDVFDASELERDPGDDVLLELAAKEGRVLVTMDNDFGALVYRDAMPHAGIVRLPDVPGGQRVMLVAWVLDHHVADLSSRALITVQKDRVRVTH